MIGVRLGSIAERSISHAGHKLTSDTSFTAEKLF